MNMKQITWRGAGGLAAALLLSPAGRAEPGANPGSRSLPAAPSAAAPAPHDSAPVALHVQGTPLRTALEMLFTGSGLQLAIEPAVPDYPITLNIHGIPFDTALRSLLRLAPGVTYRKEGEIYIVGLRQPAPEPAANAAEPPAPVETAAAPGAEEVVRIPLNYIHPAILAYVLNGRLIPTEDQFQPGIGSYGGGFNGRGGLGAYGSVSGGGLGPSGYGSLGGGNLGGFAPGWGITGSTSGLGPNVLVNPPGNSVVVAPPPRRY